MFPHPALKPGNVAVITGAGEGGIGFAVAQLLLQRYQMKVVLADINASALTAASTKLMADGVPAASFLAQVVDVSDYAEVTQLADVAFETFGKVDFLMLNAGVGGTSKDFVVGGDMENWNKILSVNLFGVLHGTQAFVQRMVEQGTPEAVVVTGSKQ